MNFNNKKNKKNCINCCTYCYHCHGGNDDHSVSCISILYKEKCAAIVQT